MPKPAAAFELRRAKLPHMFGFAVCALFVTLWLLELLIGIDGPFLLEPLFTAFIWAFMARFGFLIAYVLWRATPVVAVIGSEIHVEDTLFYWRSAILPIAGIIDVETAWSRDSDTHPVIAFRVTPELFAEQNRRGPWSERKDGRLHLHIGNTDQTPDQVVKHLRRALVASRSTA